ncbi:MAG: BatD family protein [Pseudomonadota bacterium]
MTARVRGGLSVGLLLSVLLGTSPFAHADLSARLGALRIDETRTVDLTVRYDKRNPNGEPDVSRLDKDFEIIATRRDSQYRIINGATRSFTEWTYTLRPRRTGRLRVPPVRLGGEATQPLIVTVVPLDPAIKRALAQRVFFETDVEPDRPYVQAEVVYTRRLLYAQGTQIYGEMPDTPEIPGAVVVPLGNTTRPETVERGGERFGQITQRYAIFPEQSGPLEIPSASVSGSVRMEFGGRIRRQGVHVVAEARSLDVRPIPSGWPADTPWFPAQQVDLLESWDAEPDALSVGAPRVWTLIVRAESSTGSMIPPLAPNLASPAMRSYPQPALTEERAISNHLVGSRSQDFRLLPIAPGRVEIPALTLNWWDTREHKLRTARLAMRELAVSGSETKEGDTLPADAPPAQSAPIPNRAPRREGWLWLAAALLVAASAGGALYALQRLTPPPLPRPLRRYLAAARLRRSVRRDDAADIEAALFAYCAASGRAPDEAPIERMRRVLAVQRFAPEPQEIDRRHLTELCADVLRKPRTRRGPTETALPELYPVDR